MSITKREKKHAPHWDGYATVLFIQCKYAIKLRQCSCDVVTGTGCDGQAASVSTNLEVQREQQRHIIFSLLIASAPLILISPQSVKTSPSLSSPVITETYSIFQSMTDKKQWKIDVVVRGG